MNRYEVIEKHVESLPRPLKVLDIGANLGYFSFRLAERFFGDFVMMEGSPTTAKKLMQLCLVNSNPQMSLLCSYVNLEKLRTLLQEEQFDLIIALSVIHHFDEPFNDIVRTFAENAKYIILEHAHPDETHCPNAVRVKAEPLDLSPYAPQKLISTPATGYRHIFRDVYALTGFVDKERQPPAGLSLKTFADYYGIFPHPTSVDSQIKKRKKTEALRLVKGRVLLS